MTERYIEALEKQLYLQRTLSEMPDWVKKEERHIEASIATLRKAIPFYWSENTCRVIEVAAEAAAHDICDWVFEATQFPYPNGFLWFSRPIFRKHSGYYFERDGCVGAAIAAIAWQVRGMEVTVAVWEYLDAAMDAVATGSTTLPLGITIFFRDKANEDIEDIIGISGGLVTLVSCLGFMEQEIVVHHHEAVARHVRRRLARECADAPVGIRVVHLRRRRSDPDHGHMHASRNWQWQWIVRGHWRQQYYPRQRTHKQRWIMPYVKGPDVRPLKSPGMPIFAVTR